MINLNYDIIHKIINAFTYNLIVELIGYFKIFIVSNPKLNKCNKILMLYRFLILLAIFIWYMFLIFYTLVFLCFFVVFLEWLVLFLCLFPFFECQMDLSLKINVMHETDDIFNLIVAFQHELIIIEIKFKMWEYTLLGLIDDIGNWFCTFWNE